jgi:hypothetical protein
MSSPVIQTSFNAGEWAPELNARVDLEKYQSGAALLENFFVDYRGGATTRPGSRYILQTFKPTSVRIIRFQASFTVSYILEFGDIYIRFFNNAAPVLEAPTTISSVTNANPGVVTDIAHGYAAGDWIFISGVVGMTQLNTNYYIVQNTTTNTYQLTDLFGNVVDTTTFGAYVSGGIARRVYTISSPYAASEVFDLKWVQNVNQLYLLHPNHPPYVLTLNSATNWTLAPINFGPTISTPIGQSAVSSLGAGSVNYAYVVTAVDANGQESGPSAFATISNVLDIRTTGGSNTVSWTAVSGAVSYNVYRAQPRYGAAVPVGAQFGFCGNCSATTFVDSNIAPNYDLCPPVVENPFSGAGIATITITSGGAYQGVPVPTISFTGGGGSGAAATPILAVTATSIISGGTGYFAGQIVGAKPGIGQNDGGFQIQVTSVDFFGTITGFVVLAAGNISSGTAPASLTMFISSGAGHSEATIGTLWSVISAGITAPGIGYVGAPTVHFSSGLAAATATLGASSSGNPTCGSIYNQRLALSGPVASPQQFNFSQPGAPFNYNVSNPTQADDAIQGTLSTGELNTIQALVPFPQGLIALSDKLAWLINGGSPGAPISALQTVANSHSYVGAASNPAPIVANMDILHVQSKGSIVRNLVFNFYTQVFTGTDISVLSSHLFYGFQIVDWAWAEEPFKLVWAVRNDGAILNLTFLKEQEFIAWAHSITQGAYKSVASVVESASIGNVDAVYTVTQRQINGQTVQYIERFQELFYPTGVQNAWQVDAGISYSGASSLSFTGAQHLAGATVTGIAVDNLNNTTVITPFTMPASGNFTLPPPIGSASGYTTVVVGLPFIAKLQTLALDLKGGDTIQSKRKKVSAVTVRVANALGLSAGRTFNTLVPMKDLIIGNVGTMSNQVVTNLQTTDARTVVDPQWDVFGQFCIQQSNPFPASILGVIPEIEVGDTPK